MEPFDLQRLSRVLAAAAIDPSLWTEALQTAAECTGSYGAVLLPVVGALPIVAATPSMDRSANVYVSDGWQGRDERYRGKAAFLANGVATDDDCMPLEARNHSPFYQEFLRNCNLSGWAGVRIGRGDLVWNLSLQRTPEQGSYSARELRALSELSNSLDSVVQTCAALGLAKGESALSAFDFSERAALLLDRSGHVVRVNPAAERLIGLDLQISAGRVRCQDPKSNELLQNAIRALFWSLEASTIAPIVLQKLSGGRLVMYPMRLTGLTRLSPFPLPRNTSYFRHRPDAVSGHDDSAGGLRTDGRRIQARSGSCERQEFGRFCGRARTFQADPAQSTEVGFYENGDKPPGSIGNDAVEPRSEEVMTSAWRRHLSHR